MQKTTARRRPTRRTVSFGNILTAGGRSEENDNKRTERSRPRQQSEEEQHISDRSLRDMLPASFAPQSGKRRQTAAAPRGGLRKAIMSERNIADHRRQPERVLNKNSGRTSKNHPHQ